MDLGMILDRVIQRAQNEAMNEFLAGTSRCDEVVGEVEAEGQGSSISVQFGGNQIDVQIAEGVCDELTGHPIAHDQVVEGIRTEMVQLETLEVGDTYPEKKGRTIAVEHEVQILTARWFLPKRLQSFVVPGWLFAIMPLVLKALFDLASMPQQVV